MNKDWHSGHFCCWQCDESLTGQRYVLRDEHPYCIKCYESVFANPCDECDKTIGIDSKVRCGAVYGAAVVSSFFANRFGHSDDARCTIVRNVILLFRICRTKTNTGTRPVSCAANVACRWWTNSLDRKWRKSIAETATTLSSLPGATDVETYSVQVISTGRRRTFSNVTSAFRSRSVHHIRTYLCLNDRNRFIEPNVFRHLR